MIIFCIQFYQDNTVQTQNNSNEEFANNDRTNIDGLVSQPIEPTLPSSDSKDQTKTIDSDIQSQDEVEKTILDQSEINSNFNEGVNYFEDTNKSCNIESAQTILSPFEVLEGTLSTSEEVDYYHINIPNNNYELHIVLDPEYERDFYYLKIIIYDKDQNVLYNGKAYDINTEFVCYNAIATLPKGDCFFGITRTDSPSNREINYRLYYFTY
jgi:hypothetical protein